VTAVAVPPVLTGELAPGYEIVELLRRGRDLDVYDVFSRERECRCVAKLQRPDRLGGERAHARLLREGELLMRFTHPHLVRAYEILEGPPPVVILEPLPGETLSVLLDRKGRLGSGDAARLGVQISSAVAYLHRHELLHLDVKPSNIVVERGVAKLLDLSIARAPGPCRRSVGTAGYMAPEQAGPGVLGPEADVWGIGALLLHVLTRMPPPGPGAPAPGRLAPWRRLRNGWRPPALMRAVRACLEEQPERRITLDELMSVLRAHA
jgi:eukaryotic-like serine/threonine-protein kinase